LPKKSLFRIFFFGLQIWQPYINFFEKILGYIFVFLVEFQINIFWGKILPIFQHQNKGKILGWNLKGKEEGNHFLKNEISFYP
jgi:hypothetical protein